MFSFSGYPHALVICLNLDSPTFADDLDRHLAIAPDLIRGVRHILNWNPENRTACSIPREFLYKEDRFLDNLRILEKKGLHFEVHAYHGQLKHIADGMVKELPNLQFIINHTGTFANFNVPTPVSSLNSHPSNLLSLPSIYSHEYTGYLSLSSSS